MTTKIPRVPKVIRAERLELVDPNGQLRARIGPRTQRTSNGTYRYYRLELFDMNGAVCASVSVDERGNDSEASIGKQNGSQVEIRAWKAKDHPAHAEVTVRGGQGFQKGRRSIRVAEGSFPDTYDNGPTIMYDNPFISDLYSLDRACREAQGRVVSARKQSAEARGDGDRLRARRLASEARRLEGRIKKAREDFTAREAAREAAWDKEWTARQALRFEKSPSKDSAAS